MKWRRVLPAATTEPSEVAESAVDWKTWGDPVKPDWATRDYLAGEALRLAEYAGQAADSAASDALNDFSHEAVAFSQAALALGAASQAYSALLGVLRPGDLPADDDLGEG